MRMKRTLFSIVLLAALAVQGLYAQATREEIFNDIATTGGVYYAYPGPSGVQTKAPKVMNRSISVTMAVMVPAG